MAISRPDYGLRTIDYGLIKKGLDALPPNP